MECVQFAEWWLAQDMARDLLAHVKSRFPGSRLIERHDRQFRFNLCVLVHLEYPFLWGKGVLNGYSSTRVSLWNSLMFGRVLEHY